jgi:branched-subunit amino acid aminotransferase/4-amino-4-deoxychorismate lyase
MTTDLIWLDGKICSSDEFRVRPTDEFVLYGRGLFETTRTFAGRPWLWDKHLQRALGTARAIGIDLPLDKLPTAVQVSDYVKQVSTGDVVVRLSVGAGSRKGEKTIWMNTRPLPASSSGTNLFTSRYRVSRSDELSGHKTTNYLLRQLAFEEAISKANINASSDALLLSPEEEVLETAHSNLFARFDEEWWTPPIAGGVLPGTVRSLLIENADSLRIKERSFHIDELAKCDEAVVTNSVRGIVPVASIDERPLKQTARMQPLMEVIVRSQTESR